MRTITSDEDTQGDGIPGQLLPGSTKGWSLYHHLWIRVLTPNPRKYRDIGSYKDNHERTKIADNLPF